MSADIPIPIAVLALVVPLLVRAFALVVVAMTGCVTPTTASSGICR